MDTNRTTTCPTCGKTISANIAAEDLACPNRPRYARGGIITGTGGIDIPGLVALPPTPPPVAGSAAMIVVNFGATLTPNIFAVARQATTLAR